ncbi:MULTISPECIES: ATP-binding protein [unclassified Streptococcus]|uniref:ATP-binding protein n=1 Tax=unclassified Streptococcus TaxID=2608887 RepID=UPI00359DA7F7
MTLKASFDIPQAVEIHEVCPIHSINLQQIPKPLTTTIGRNANYEAIKAKRHIPPFCPLCRMEQTEQENQARISSSLNQQLYSETYHVLERDSNIPSELQGASFDTFKVSNQNENQLLEFVVEQSEKYLGGMKGNTLITGDPGIGKSHLSLAMAKAINEGYKAKGEPKSVLFISLTEIIKEIQEGWNYGRNAKLTAHDAKRLLTGVDYLILDDIGEISGEIGKTERDLIFDVLNHRETTIFTTNLDSQQLKRYYGDKIYNRILKGLEGNSYKAFGIAGKRYAINRLRENGTL